MSAAHGTLYTFYSLHLDRLGMASATIGWLWALGVLAEIAVFHFWPYLARRFGAKRIWVASFAAAIVRFGLIGNCGANLIALNEAQVLHGLTFGAFHAASLLAVQRYFPPHWRSRGQAIYSSVAFGAGGAVGAMIAGFSWARFEAQTSFLISAGIAAIGLIFAMCQHLVETRSTGPHAL